jgi:hypothetical protein
MDETCFLSPCVAAFLSKEQKENKKNLIQVSAAQRNRARESGLKKKAAPDGAKRCGAKGKD